MGNRIRKNPHRFSDPYDICKNVFGIKIAQRSYIIYESLDPSGLAVLYKENMSDSSEIRPEAHVRTLSLGPKHPTKEPLDP